MGARPKRRSTRVRKDKVRPARRDDEDRAAYLDRFIRTNKPLWRVLTLAERDQVCHHVTTCDLPETAAVWCDLGREAGFLRRGKSSSIRRTSSGTSALRDEIQSQLAIHFVAVISACHL